MVHLPEGITGLEEGVFSACSGLVFGKFPRFISDFGKIRFF